MNTFQIFGIPIQGASLREVCDLVQQQTMCPCWIVTANPEILLAARRDVEYAKTLRRADLCLVDGFGLWLLLRLFGHKTHRVTGVEIAECMIQYSIQHDLKVAFLGGESGIAEKAAEETRRAYPLLNVHAEQGGLVQQDGSTDAVGDTAISRLIQYAPEILLVAFGHPKQERWIERHVKELPSVKIAIGIGGTFNYWAGKIRRAPSWMRSLGCEWLWRLLCEPRRWKRIVDAVILFPWYFVKDHMAGTHSSTFHHV